MSFPPGRDDLPVYLRSGPAGFYAAADANSQTIGTRGATAATQTASGNPFTLEDDLRFPLEGMRNTSTFPRDYPGSYDVFCLIFMKCSRNFPKFAKIKLKFENIKIHFFENFVSTIRK